MNRSTRLGQSKLLRFGLFFAVNLIVIAALLLRADKGTQVALSFDPEDGGDTCTSATLITGAFPYTDGGTTVGKVDSYDLPADVTDPTCTASTTGTGTGPLGSLPRGAIYTGTGTGPDAAYQVTTSANCTLQAVMDPTSSQDLALMVYQSQCTSSLADCVVVSDAGVSGQIETVTFDAIAGTPYYIVIDGYSAGAVPPGPSGPYNLTVSETTTTGCTGLPLAITLAGFSAAQQGDSVLVLWETVSELNTLGFNLWRGTSPTEPDEQLNTTLIPSQAPGSSGGSAYTWDDQSNLVSGTTYFYWLEEADIVGMTTRHGPVSVDFAVPTAVTLRSLQATATVGTVVPLAGAMLALLASLAGVAWVTRGRRA